MDIERELIFIVLIEIGVRAVHHELICVINIFYSKCFIYVIIFFFGTIYVEIISFVSEYLLLNKTSLMVGWWSYIFIDGH